MPTNSKAVLRISQLVSIIFHPLLTLTYILILLLLINPYAFGVNQIGEGKSMLFLMSVFISTFLLPLISIALMKNIGMVSSFGMHDRMDRVGPFLVAGIFYLSLCYNFYHLPDMPLAFKSAFLGVTIALFLSFFMNLFSKISLHTVGMGALIGAILVAMILFNYTTIQIGNWIFSLYLLLFVMIFLAGLVGSARLSMEAHYANDLYGGYLVGFATQLIALQLIS